MPPHYVELARVVLDTANRQERIPFKVSVINSPSGYICAAETIMESEDWMYRLLRHMRIRAIPDASAPDTRVVQVLGVATTAPLATIDHFRNLLPQQFEQEVKLWFLLGDSPDDRRKSKKAIEASFITADSVDARQFKPTTSGRCFALAHGQHSLPPNQSRFWQDYAKAIRATGLCTRVHNTDDDVAFELTESAARNLLPSLTLLVGCYPL